MTDDLAALRTRTDHPLEEVAVRAVDLVVDAHGDLDVWYAIGTGALEGRRSAVVRFARRAGMDVAPASLGAAPSGVDGDDHLVAVPAAEAVALCQAFCRRHPGVVRRHLDAEERRIAQGGIAPGGERTARRARALVRSWIDERRG